SIWGSGTAYYNEAVIDSMDLWPMLWKIKLEEERELWALVELCLCCPYGNACSLRVVHLVLACSQIWLAQQ
ncbi:Hypothetical predicted protein, partial [Paramuricea clavata]